VETALTPLSPFVWGAIALRAIVFFVVVYLILRRTLSIRKEISERKFAGRYQARTIIRGVFSPVSGWERPFNRDDVEVLRKTRRYFVYTASLSLLVVLVNQQTQKYIDRQLEDGSTGRRESVP
jgi:hypothetical protein